VAVTFPASSRGANEMNHKAALLQTNPGTKGDKRRQHQTIFFV
jgi:hypothetical protein